MKLYLIPLLLLSFLTTISAKQAEAKKAEQNLAISPLEGLWKAVSGHEDEDPMDAEDIATIFMKFQGNTVLATYDEEADHGSFTYEAEKNRTLITLTIDDEKVTIPMIYKLEKDQLTICHFDDFEEKAKSYPDSFEPTDGLIIIKLKRLPIDTRLKGNWKTKELWDMGELADEKFNFDFGKSTLSVTDVEDPDAGLGSYLTNSTTSPKRIHLYSDEGDFQKGIYKIEKRILHICIIEDDAEATDKQGYPKDFIKNEDSIYIQLIPKK
ncbi:MAG: hypothetical protein ACI9E1_001780 [Cryomorphaceae bacterium]|jgi:uncharacterized protein (TIGR03067 family)